MKELYDIIMEVIPYIPWFVVAYIVHNVCKSKSKYSEVICGKILKIKTRK